MKTWKNWLALSLTGAMLMTALPVQTFALDELSSGYEENEDASVITESSYEEEPLFEEEASSDDAWILDDSEEIQEETYVSEESDDFSDLLDDGEAELVLEDELSSGEEVSSGEELDDGEAELDEETIQTGTTDTGIGWSYDPSTRTMVLTPGTEKTVLDRNDLLKIMPKVGWISKMRTLKVTDGFTEIEDGTFYSSTNLKSVYLADSITVIERTAFEYCERLESVRLPASLSEIGDSAFANCIRLSSITIPSNVEYIDKYAFLNCPQLKEITVLSIDCELGNDMVFGYLMGVESEYVSDLTLYCYPGSTTEEYAQNLGISYELIGDYLSGSCGENLSWELLFTKKMLIIRGVGSMENYFTKGPDWGGMQEIDSILVERGVTSIGAYAFFGLEASSVTMPDTITEIRDYAFSDMDYLNEITILNRNASIGDHALGYVYGDDGSCYSKSGFVIYGYTGSTAETYASENNMTFVPLNQSDVLTGECGDYAYWKYTRATKTLEITGNSTGDFSLTDESNLPPWLEILDPADITTVIVAKEVYGIGSYTFAGLTSLNHLELLGSEMYIGPGAFANCSALTNVDLPDGTYTIDDSAFANCTSLTSIDLPEELTKIGSYAFSNCTSLSSVNFPEGLEQIGDYAFDGCTSLRKVVLPTVLLYQSGFGIFKNCTSLEEADLYKTRGQIKAEMFMNCSSLQKIIFPRYCGYIDESAFENCISLSDLTIPEYIDGIYYRAFFNCPGIKTVTIPARRSGVDIHEYAFGYLPSSGSYGYKTVDNFTLRGYSRCTAVRTYAEENGFIYEEMDYPTSGSAGDHATWRYDASTKTLMIQGTGAIKDWEEEYISEAEYTAFPADWFGWAPEIENIVIGEGITTVGTSSFIGITNVSRIELPDTLTTIKDGGFACMDSIEEVVFPKSITSIDPTAFYYTKLSKIYGYTGTESETYANSLYYYDDLTFIDRERMEAVEAETIRIESTQIADGYITITWTASSNAETFRIYRREGRGTTRLVKIVQSNVKQYKDTSVEAGKTYTYMAVGAYDTARSNKVSKAVTYKAVPQVQTKLQSASILVSWEADSNAAGYRLYRTDGNGNLTRVYLKSGETSYTDTKVTGGSSYIYAIQAYNGRDVVIYKAQKIVYIAEPTVTLTNDTSGVNVKWTSVDGSDGYNIYRKSGTGSYQKIATPEASETSYIDTTAASGTTYTYAVRALSGSQQSVFTGKAVLYLKTPAVTLTNTTAGVQLKWSTVAGNKGYYIYRKTGTGKYTRIASAATGSTTYVDQTASGGTTYTYAVRACSGTTLSAFAGKTIRYLTAPTVTAKRITGKTTVLLSWNRSTGASGYYIYRKSGSGSYTRIGVVSGNTTVAYSDTKASRTVKYTYAVRAFYGNYLSAFIPVTES